MTWDDKTPTTGEILLRLESHAPRSYKAILALHDGSLARAAYQLAWWRNEVRGYVRPTPNRGDLRRAAAEIIARGDDKERVIPTGKALAEECEADGLNVLP